MSIKNLFHSLFFILITFCISLSFSFNSQSHALLPDEVVTFIEENPNATDAEIEQFFKDTYGYGIEEFWAQNPDPLDELMKPSEEFLNMQANADPKDLEGLSQDTINRIAEKTMENNQAFQQLSRADQQAFLQNAMQLKFSGEKLSTWETVKKFVPIGISHILSGTDHILFILSILLLFVPFKRLLLLISIFTISHSLTLLLAGMNILTLSSQIVEPIIAFSIAYTALTSLWKNSVPFFADFKNHAITIFLFGLFHGLGFAGSFSELQISSDNYFIPLLSMNVGVEIGQLFIILLAFPIFWMIHNQKGGKIILQIFSIGIALLALFWVWQRLQ